MKIALPVVGSTSSPAVDSLPRRPVFHRRLGWLGLGLAWLAGTAHAQLPQPRLQTLFPPGGTRGSNVVVQIQGADLDETKALWFSDPRLRGSPRPGEPNAFEVLIPADLPPGWFEVRAQGRFGLSNPRAFEVGTCSEALAPATNTSPALAFDAPLDTMLSGRVVANAAAWFRFAAKPGQPLLARLETRELDSRLVGDLTAFDSGGRELAVARRAALLSVVAPEDGLVGLRLNDQTFRGGDEFVYRLIVQTSPWIQFAVPGVLKRGETNRVTLHGFGLPGGSRSVHPGSANPDPSWERATVEIVVPKDATASVPEFPLFRVPAAATLDLRRWTWTPTGAATVGPVSTVGFTLTDDPVHTLRGAPNEFVEITPPCEIAGWFPPRGALAGASFAAKKGEVWWIELASERLGFSSDAWAIVQRQSRTEKGEEQYVDVVELPDLDANQGGRDVDTATRDAAGRFQAPEDGRYRVVVRDLFQRSRLSAGAPYRLSVRRETPGFALAAFPLPPPRLNDNDHQIHLWSLSLRRGETRPVRVVAWRADGFAGPIDLRAENLPPGVTAAPARIAPGQSSGTLLLTAADDAPDGHAQLRLSGEAHLGERDVTQRAWFATGSWAVPDWDNERGNGRLTFDLPVSVVPTELAPVRIVLESESLEMPAGGRTNLTIRLVRQPDFTAGFSLRFAGQTEAEKLKEISFAEKATHATLEINLADPKIPEGEHLVWLQGQVSGKYRNNPEALAAAEAELKAAEQELASASGDHKPAAEEKRKAAEARKKAAEERAKPRDVTVAVYSRPLRLAVQASPPPEKK